MAAKNSANAMLMVTHIGSSICRKMKFKARVDGIEAKGLDEELELIVDRVPNDRHSSEIDAGVNFEEVGGPLSWNQIRGVQIYSRQIVRICSSYLMQI